MVDSGAGISLISTEITEAYMKTLPLRPSVDIKVNAISGLVREHSVPIDFYTECNLYFPDSDYVFKPVILLVVPYEFMPVPLVLGAVALKENDLLPDLTTRELVHRSDDCIESIARDESLNIPFYKCVTVKSI